MAELMVDYLRATHTVVIKSTTNGYLVWKSKESYSADDWQTWAPKLLTTAYLIGLDVDPWKFQLNALPDHVRRKWHTYLSSINYPKPANYRPPFY